MERPQAEQSDEAEEQEHKVILRHEIPLLIRDLVIFPFLLAPYAHQELKAFIAKIRAERATGRGLDDKVE